MLKKAKEMQDYVEELIECLEEAEHEDYEDEDYYQERGNYRNNTSMRSRYGYRRM